MSLRESLSGFKKGIKKGIKGVKRKLGGKGATPVGDRVDSWEPGSQSVGGSTRDQGTSVVDEPVNSARPSVSQDGPGPASVGDTNKEGGRMDVGRNKVSMVRESGLISLVGTGDGEGVERVHSSPSSALTPHVAEPSGMSTSSSPPPSLMIPPKTSLLFLIMNHMRLTPRAGPTQPVNPSARHISGWNRVDQCLRP